MTHLGAFERFAADLGALQSDVERAGSAWACPYSSSDEFEAAIIRSKRRAGAYRVMQRRYALYAAVTGVLVALALTF
jgi:hypothetical protein